MKKIITLSLSVFMLYSGAFASSGTLPVIIEKPIVETPTTPPKKPIKGLVILGNNYAVDSDFVYVVNDTRSSWIQMPDADRVTFRVLGGQFARDVDHVFQMGQKIPGVDLASFSVISGQYGYAQDDNHIYGPHGIIPEANPDTFRMLTKNYSIDAGHVFFDGKNIPEANSGSFEVINNGLYALDDKTVFYAGNVLKNTSPEGFMVKGGRAFTADGRTFFQGLIEKGELPRDEVTETPDTPDTPITDEPDEVIVEPKTAEVWRSFWERVSPYTSYFSGKNSLFWAIMALSMLGVFSILFVFFASRNDEPISLWKSILKTLIAVGVMGVTVWIGSFFFTPLTAIILGGIVGLFFFMTLWGALGWIKSLLITVLTLIGIVVIMTLGFIVLRAIFGDTQSILAFINQPKIQLMNIMKVVGLFGGAWLISSQLGSSLARSIGQAIVATAIALIILGLLTWILHTGTLVSILLFSLFYAVLLWIMRFRMVSNLFAETVRIVRIALIIAVVTGLMVWIIL